MALALAMLSLVSCQFFVNLGDKTKAPGTDVDKAAGQGSAPAVPTATDGDVQAQADPNVKLQVKDSTLLDIHHFLIKYFCSLQFDIVMSKYRLSRRIGKLSLSGSVQTEASSVRSFPSRYLTITFHSIRSLLCCVHFASS